jgi:hypothetical protein
VEQGSFLKLNSCPAGYYVSPAGVVTLTAAIAQQQECLPCQKGYECVNAPCVTCSLCVPGYYKAAVTTESCLACPQNTYRTISGATELSNCLSCPAASTTARTASTRMDQCVCSIRMYSTELADFACMTCPTGAVCSDGSCALSTSILQCAPGMDAIKGIWTRSIQDGRYSLHGCPVGHRLNNRSGHDVQACLQCPEGRYMLDPNDPSQTCQVCPQTATCPNRGPPVFEQAAAIEGSLLIDGDISDMDAIVRALAASLGVDPSMIVLGDVSKVRRGQLKIAFKIFADESTAKEISQSMGGGFMESLTANLAKAGVNATITPDFKQVTKEKNREGEFWSLQDGVYVLKSCPVGFLLLNSTIETQTCKECEDGKYATSSDYGCDATTKFCDSRECVPCANGATCGRGSSPVWQHFVPKALLLGNTVLPWVTLITGGMRRVLFCEQETKTCTPPLGEVKGMDAAQDDHVWEFDELLQSFVLKVCPPGHQLINSSAGIFNPVLQRCDACGAAKYIIDRGAPCMDCPKGAFCPDGAQFLPLAVGSVWEEVRASNGGIQKRLVQCPAGYALARDLREAVAIGDECRPCPKSTYRLIPSTLADLNSSTADPTNQPQCKPCDQKATCQGSDNVEAIPGYWRLNPTPWGTDEMDNAFEYIPDFPCQVDREICLFPEGLFVRSGWSDNAGLGGTMRCMRLPGGGDQLFCARATAQRATRRQQDADSNATNATTTVGNAMSGVYDSVYLFRCPVGACDSNNRCLQNRTGPVCGFCKPGFAMQTDGCSSKICPTDAELYQLKLVVGVLVILFLSIFYLAFIARPVLPELDWLLTHFFNGCLLLLRSIACLGNTKGDSAEMCTDFNSIGNCLYHTSLTVWRILGGANRWAKQHHIAQYLKVCWHGLFVFVRCG